MTYKALITDLDGTAINIASDGSDITAQTIAAVKKAQAKGIKIACATGRRWTFTKQVVKKLNIRNACIIEGGTRIIDPVTEKTLWEKHLDVDTLAVVLGIFQKESKEGFLSTFNLRREPLHSINDVAAGSRFMYLLGIEPVVADRICNIINAGGFAVAHPTRSWAGDDKLDVHVTHPEATKEHALLAWHTIEDITKAETIGMGDSGNDVPLFQSAGLKVAVSNANPELKGLADYIAPNDRQQALAHVIKKFFLS